MLNNTRPIQRRIRNKKIDKMHQGYSKLWRMVLNKAYDDLCNNHDKYAEEMQLLIETEDFNLMCEYADLPLEITYKLFKDKIFLDK